MTRMSVPTRILRLLLVLFATLVVHHEAFAQESGGIQGTVFDDTDLELPGATVTLSSEEGVLGGDQSVTTGGDGYYQFIKLLPGYYTLRVDRDGFKPVTLTDVLVKVGRNTTTNVVMQPGSSVEEIEVVAKRQTVDVEDTTRGEVLTKDFLQRIPTGRSYQSAVSLASGVTGGNGGNPNMAGGAYNENTYMLDGVNITDPVTGTFSVNFNYDAIEQIEVLLGGYEPEYGVSLGGVVNLVTESGTNNLEFDTNVYYTNGDLRPRMDARYTADGATLASTGFDNTFQIIRVAAKISGPVIRDRAWFVFSYQYTRSIIAAAGVAQPRDFDAQYVLGKLTVQPTTEHRLNAMIQLDPTAIDNNSQTDIIKPEAQYRQAQGGFVGQLRWQWFISPNANLDTQVVTQKSYIEIGPVPCTHDRDLGYHPCKVDEQEGDLDWETPGRTGLYGAYDSVNWGYFNFDDRWRYAASSKLSVLSVKDPFGSASPLLWGGKHDFKAGVEFNTTVWDQIQGYSGNTLYYDLNEVSYDPSTFTNYYWLEITGPIKFRTTGTNYSAFLQDAWKPAKNLTLKYGFRFDGTQQRNDVQDTVIDTTMWSPRVYAAWDPWADQKTKIAGGYGRFNDTGRLAVADFTSTSGYGSKLFLGEYFGSTDGQGYLNSPSLMYDISTVDNPNIAHSDMITPRVDEFVVLLQRQIITDVSVGTNLTAKFTRYLYEPDELSVIYDEDGSAIIGSRYGDWQQSVYRMRTPELAKRDYYQADVFVEKVQSNRWGGRVTYTFTQSIGSSTSALSGSFLNDPQTQYNYGLLNTDLNHVVKGYGFWVLPTDPWNQTLGFTFEYYSGAPLERFYWSEAQLGSYATRVRPRGVYYRWPSQWQLSLKFQQNIDVRKGALVLDFEVQNMFNNRAPDSLSSAFYSTGRLFVRSRQDPLRFQFGLRYSF